jgi:hypothetical protein
MLLHTASFELDKLEAGFRNETGGCSRYSGFGKSITILSGRGQFKVELFIVAKRDMQNVRD